MPRKYGLTYGTNVAPSVGSWRSPIEVMALKRAPIFLGDGHHLLVIVWSRSSSPMDDLFYEIGWGDDRTHKLMDGYVMICDDMSHMSLKMQNTP